MFTRQASSERNRVIDQMKVVVSCIQNSPPVGSYYVCFLNNPLARYGPVKALSVRGNLKAIERDKLPNNVMGPSRSMARYTPKKRPQSLKIVSDFVNAFPGHATTLFSRVCQEMTTKTKKSRGRGIPILRKTVILAWQHHNRVGLPCQPTRKQMSPRLCRGSFNSADRGQPVKNSEELSPGLPSFLDLRVVR
jgi:hypothetical protein